MNETKRLEALATVLGIVREAYMKNHDSSYATAAIVLSELSLKEIEVIENETGS